MKNILIVAFIALSGFMNSCSPEENIVNAGQEFWTLLTVFSSPNQLQTAKVENGSLTNESIRFSSDYSIENIYEYRNYLFLMMPSVHSIMILDRATYATVKTIDFTASKRKPYAIAFANATTAYIAHKDDSVVTIYDLQNFAIAGDIKVGNNPVAIQAGIGDRQNQIFVANYSSNTISQIDSRTNTVVQQYSVQPGPRFIACDPTGKKIVVACDGSGKRGFPGNPSTPSVAFIDIDKKTILAQTSISTRKEDSVLAYPIGLAVTQSEWAFVPLSNGLIQLDTREYKNYSTISATVYSSISFNQRRKELILSKGNEVFVMNENTGVLKHTPLMLSKPVLTAIGQ